MPGQQDAPQPAMTSISIACVRNMTCRGLGMYNLDVGGEMVAMGRMARIWEEANQQRAEL